MNAISPNFRPDPDVSVSRDSRWRKLTTTAHQAKKRSDHDAALALYRAALNEAEKLFSTANQKNLSIPLPALLNISYHNLADTFAQTGDTEACRQMLTQAFEQICALARCPNTDLALRLACVKHLRFSLVELATHLKTHGAAPYVIDLYLADARQVSAQVFHALGNEKRGLLASCNQCTFPN